MSRPLRLLFIAIPIIWVAVAHLGPLLAMGRISLFEAYPLPPGEAPVWSLSAFRTFLEGPGYLASLGRSLWLAGLAAAIALFLAWPLAWHVAVKTPRKARVLRIALLAAPFWSSEILRVFALMLLLSNRGAVNAALKMMGVTTAPIPLLYGTGSVVLGLVYTAFLTMLLPIYAALDRMPVELLEASTDLGARSWQTQLFVGLPQAAEGVACGVGLTFLLSLGVIAAPALLGDASAPSFSLVIAGFFGGASGRWPQGAAFGLILLLAGAATTAALAFVVLRHARTGAVR
jgi:spermidine/putrescine transport system permease protein